MLELALRDVQSYPIPLFSGEGGSDYEIFEVV